MPLPMTGCRRLLSHCWISVRGATCLTTASLLAEAARQAAGNELLFRAVHHVTAALDSIQPAPQRQMFRELSLLAARRAKRTGDYHSALSYSDRQSAGQCRGGVDFMLDIEEAGCEFALGHRSEPASCVTRSSAAPAD